MKRFFTILFSVAALLLAIIFVSCSNDDSSSGGDDYYIGGGNETIILHAQYYNNIFIWESGISELDEHENEMTAEYDGWYSFEIKSNSAGFLFFRDNWENKTEDLHATAGEYWYKDGNLYSYNPNSGSSSIPSAPQNVRTEATSSSSIKVSWDSVEDADSYSIYYRLSLEAGNESYERDGTETATTTTDTSVSIYGLTEWEIYLFWVTAKNSAGESHESDIELNYPCSATDPDENGSESGNSGTTTTTLSAPTGLSATAASSSSVELSWNSVSSATTYYVYKSESSSSSTASVIGSTTSTSTTATGLKANTKYYFWVKAVNDTTISDYSSYGYATTKATSSSSSGTTTSNTATIYFVGSSSAISATGFNNIYVGNYQFGDLFTSVKTSKTLSAGTVDGPYQIKAGTYLLKFGNPTRGEVSNSSAVRKNAVKDRNGRIKGYSLSTYYLSDYKFEFEEGKVYTLSKISGTTSAKNTSGTTIRANYHSIKAEEGTD